VGHLVLWRFDIPGTSANLAGQAGTISLGA
jgi:hypothetical protein